MNPVPAVMTGVSGFLLAELEYEKHTNTAKGVSMAEYERM